MPSAERALKQQFSLGGRTATDLFAFICTYLRSFALKTFFTNFAQEHQPKRSASKRDSHPCSAIYTDLFETRLKAVVAEHHLSRLAEIAEESTDFAGERLGLLHRREMAAAGHDGPAADVGERPRRNGSRRMQDLARERRIAHRNIDRA